VADRRQDVLIVIREGGSGKRGCAAGGNQALPKLGGLMWLTALDTHETGIGMIAHRFADGHFLIGLLVGHTLIDSFEDLLFGEAGIFQARNLPAAESRKALQAAVKYGLHGGIGEPDQPEHDGVAADGVELIGAREFQNLRLGVAHTQQVGRGIGAAEKMFPRVRRFHQGDTGVIGGFGLLELYDLGDFGVCGVKSFELLDAAGPHSGLIEGAVVREGVLMAAGRKEETNSGEQNARFHSFIVPTGTQGAGACAVADTRPKDR
jgi:hypothetical protein